MRISEDRMATLLCSDHVERDIHIWEPSEVKAVFMAIHGGLAHGGDYVTPALYFKQKGVATVSYDMVGHNRQKRVHITSFDQFLDDGELFLKWVKSQYPGVPIFIMGHSMGGLIATHLGLKRLADEESIKGYIVSSPYLVNNVKIPAVIKALSGLLSTFLPKLKAPVMDFTDVLTHDPAITQRHRKDEKDFIRASECTCRFAVELTEAQSQLEAILPSWKHPLFAVVAGKDKLAAPEGIMNMFKLINQNLIECHFYSENYHENFNEVNRNEIFEKINTWIGGFA